MSRHPRRAIANETVAILDQGSYAAPSGRTVVVGDRLAETVRGTRLHLPGEVGLPRAAGELAGRVEVTGETTLAAARRLVATGDDEVACLNFASAKNPGGGFLNGAHAQEEGLARSSGLYASLRAAREFYDFHRAQSDLLYSDRVIYSPGVPVFRDDAGGLLEEPYEVAFLTSAAPNRGAIRDPEVAARIGEALRSRAAQVLGVAHQHGHRRLVLGAWGCGVFRNDPGEVAEVFAGLLLGGGVFAGHFERVVFAVWDTAADSPRHTAFVRTFAAL